MHIVNIRSQLQVATDYGLLHATMTSMSRHRSILRLVLLGALLLLMTSLPITAFAPRFLPSSGNTRKLSGMLAVGPRSEGSGRRHMAPTRQPRRRQEEVAVEEFDGRALTAAQIPNEGAPPLDLKNSNLLCMSDDNLNIKESSSTLVRQPCFEFKSLDEIHVGLSAIFNSSAGFRNALRLAIRQDIFDSTPAYATLSAKAASILLLPDSSLQGSWRRSSSNSHDSTKKR
ncbi:hypothetical protein MHU86_10931 [Fragilaria crotonensis]|nr:hypothetical protein MHU86_10931 [Fragilaria crotonensis]